MNAPIANSRELREAFVKSLILAALENLMKYDADPTLQKAVHRRYIDLTGGANDNG